jgi:DNA-directed DNA polymerase III PolC
VATDPLPGYAELHCVSNFTFLRGASHPHELVERAHAQGYRALALTDECSVAGVVRAHVAAKELALPLIVGTEVALDDGPRLVLLATDRTGYGELVRLVTRGRRAAPKGGYRLARADVEALPLDRCLALWVPGTGPAAALADEGGWVRERFGTDASLAVELLTTGLDRDRLAHLTALGADLGLACVASGDVHMHVRERRPLSDVLTAIRLGTTVEAAGYALHPNGERHLRTRARLARLYPPPLLARTLELAERCTFSLDELRYEYPDELVPDGHTPASWLRELTERGLAGRFPGGAPARVRELVERELALIAELGYEPYFLTVHDLVAFARARGILCQGRGSAANSAVCYCLRVTEVDPSRMQLLFERFVSKERNEPPDIDVDFEHERREEVIQYLYAKYGRQRAALAATVISYHPRSAIRDVGKALGLDGLQVDRMARAMQWWDGSRVDEARVREAGLDPASPVVARCLARVREIVGFPRHLSQHVGGFVIARRTLEELVPVENATMPERTVIQWDKDDLDDLGLLKVDVLALGMLTAIRRAMELANEYMARTAPPGPARPLALDTIPPEDPATYEMISRADTVGVFQIESRAQMAMLPRLKPRNYYDLVIEVAIIRPGPIQGDMVHPYLRRRNGLEQVSYPSEEVRGVLERTLGVPIFQEQVMQLAVVAAGFSPGEADRLRRAMAAWKRRGGLGPFEARLIEGMRARGYAEEFARAIFNQILGFGEYGFPECVVGGTRVVDAATGRWPTVEELVRTRVLPATLACEDGARLVPRAVEAVRASGEKAVFRVRTALGHELVASAEHPLLGPGGWRTVGELVPGDRVAAAGRLAVRGRRRASRARLAALAARLAGGGAAAGLPPHAFELAPGDLAFLLARLFERAAPRGDGPGPRFASRSRRLAREVQHLLLRFGVVARLAPASGLVRGGVVTVADAASRERFHATVGRHFRRPWHGAGRPRPAPDVVWDRVVAIEPAGRAPTYDLQVARDHCFLADNLVVHNSHSASFALLVYSSAWLKRHEPAAFAAALLNSQPMGFYAPAQLVRDAREHGVEVRPVDANVSDVDATLEPPAAAAGPRPAHDYGRGGPAVRLGLKLVRGLSAESAARIVAARRALPFASVQDLAERAALDRHDLAALAAAGALAGFAGHRHRAAWEVAGVVAPAPLFPQTRIAEALPLLAAPGEGQDIVADYRALGLTLGRHPLALLRPRLARAGLATAASLGEAAHGARVRAAGLVLLRQRPGSASGVTFVTLEDETGVVNLVVWRQVAERWRRALLEARLLEAAGTLQREGDVLHLVVRRLVDRSALLGNLATRSRDFH